MISIVIPCKEEPYLENLLTNIKTVIHEPYEVLIQTEKGLGYAVSQGIKRSKGNLIVILDGDGSHNPRSIPFMTTYIDKYVNGYDIVVGSRYNGGLTVKDNMSGFFAAKRSVFEKYPIENKGYKILLELLVNSKGDLKTMEYPIVFEQRKLGKSKANLTQGIITLGFMIKLLKEKYK
jgi:dolichol-phosphate mannosyltransferase